MVRSSASDYKLMGGLKDQSKKSKGKQQSDLEAASSSSDDETTSRSTMSSGLPKFHKGTTWPLDSTLEILIHYEAVKEVRTVKQDFYPLLYHLTRVDYESIAKSLSSVKAIRKYLRDRFCSHPLNDPPVAKREMRSASVSKKIQKDDKCVILDLSEAKTEILKLLSTVALKRQQFANLLLWMQRLELRGGGRWSGEMHIAEGVGKQADKKNTKSSRLFANYAKEKANLRTRQQQKRTLKKNTQKYKSLDLQDSVSDTDNETDEDKTDVADSDVAKKSRDFKVLYNGKIFMSRGKNNKEVKKNEEMVKKKRKSLVIQTRRRKLVYKKGNRKKSDSSSDSESDSPPSKRTRGQIDKKSSGADTREGKDEMLSLRTRGQLDKNPCGAEIREEQNPISCSKSKEKHSQSANSVGKKSKELTNTKAVTDTKTIDKEMGGRVQSDCKDISDSIKLNPFSVCDNENDGDILFPESQPWMSPPRVQIENLEEDDDYEVLYLKVDDPSVNPKVDCSTSQTMETSSSHCLKSAKVVLSDIMNSTLDEIYKATTGGLHPSVDQSDGSSVSVLSATTEQHSSPKNNQKARMRLLPITNKQTKNRQGSITDVSSDIRVLCHTDNTDQLHNTLYDSPQNTKGFRTLGLNMDGSESIKQSGISSNKSQSRSTHGEDQGIEDCGIMPSRVETLSQVGKSLKTESPPSDVNDKLMCPRQSSSVKRDSFPVHDETVASISTNRETSNLPKCSVGRASPDTSGQFIKIETEKNEKESILVTLNMDDVGCIEILDDDDGGGDGDVDKPGDSRLNERKDGFNRNMEATSSLSDTAICKEADAIIIIDDD